MIIKTFDDLDQYNSEIKSKPNHELLKIFYGYNDNLKLGYGLPIEFDLIYDELENRGFTIHKEFKVYEH